MDGGDARYHQFVGYLQSKSGGDDDGGGDDDDDDFSFWVSQR